MIERINCIVYIYFTVFNKPLLLHLYVIFKTPTLYLISIVDLRLVDLLVVQMVHFGNVWFIIIDCILFVAARWARRGRARRTRARSRERERARRAARRRTTTRPTAPCAAVPPTRCLWRYCTVNNNFMFYALLHKAKSSIMTKAIGSQHPYKNFRI